MFIKGGFMNEGGLSPADIMAMTNNGDMNGNNAFFWIFALLLLGGLGNNGWGNNGFNNAIGYENLATSNEVQRGFDNQNQLANEREILNAVTSGTAQSVAATNQSFHDVLGIVQDKYTELQRDIAALQVGQANQLANQNQCCCETKMLIAENAANTNAQIAQNKYDMSMQMAQMEANLNAKMDSNTIQNLRDQVDALRDQVNMSGVLRFPNSWSYGAGTFPPIFGCCGGNAYNNI